MNDYISLSGSDLEKSKQLVSLIDKISSNNSPRMNCLILSMPLLSIIEQSVDFKHIFSDGVGFLGNPLLVGHIHDIECYVDLFIPLNRMILTYDKKTVRDIKIESLTNSIDSEYEITIDVDY